MANLGDVLRQVVCTPKHIPDDWAFLKLTDVCSPKQWKTISSIEMTATGYPVFGANGFVGFYPEYNHADETVAITCRGNTCGTINRIPPKTYITGNSMALDDIKSNVVLQKYLYYALKYRGVGDSVSGSAQPQITGAGLRSIEFPAPPLPEQQKIATILSSVDDVIEKTRAQIDKLKDLKTGMMQELLTKGIGHTEFKDSEVGRIPSSWEVYSLSDISEFRRGSFPQPYGNPEWYSDTGYPFVQVYDIAKNGMLKPLTKVRISEAAALKSVFVEKGSIIVSLQGSIGRVATTQYDAYVDRTILIFSNIASILDKNYFALMIGEIFREKSSEADGGVIKTITKATLKNFYLQIPPMAEQLQFSKTIGAIESKMLITTQKLEDCMALKKALMQDLLTGKVRVKLTDKESAVV